MFSDYISDFADNWYSVAASILVVAVFAIALWYLLNWLSPFDDNQELLEKGNFAYATQRISLFSAQIIGMIPVATGHSVKSDGWEAIGAMCAEGLWIMIALLVARLVVDYVVLYRVPNQQELLNGKLSVGVVEAGFYIGLGFILNGSLTGSAPEGKGLASTVVFGSLGLVLMVVIYLLHELFTRYNLREGIKAGKMTAAIETAAMLIALGVVVHAGVAGDFTTWEDSFAAFAATVVIAIPTLYLFRFLIDLVILRGCTVKSIQANNQVAAAFVLGSLLIIMSFLVEAALSTHL